MPYFTLFSPKCNKPDVIEIKINEIRQNKRQKSETIVDVCVSSDAVQMFFVADYRNVHHFDDPHFQLLFSLAHPD